MEKRKQNEDESRIVLEGFLIPEHQKQVPDDRKSPAAAFFQEGLFASAAPATR
jgi:hypothetical protein